MPIYDYQCKGCNKVWEETHLIADRLKPTKKKCPYCEEKGQVFQTLGKPPSVGNPGNFSLKKTDGAFQEVLSKIGHHHPNHKMSQFMKGKTTRGPGGHG